MTIQQKRARLLWAAKAIANSTISWGSYSCCKITQDSEDDAEVWALRRHYGEVMRPRRINSVRWLDQVKASDEELRSLRIMLLLNYRELITTL